MTRRAIYPNYGYVESVDARQIRKDFDEFYQRLLDDVPSECEHSENAYMANLFRGNFISRMSEAADAYTKWRLAMAGKCDSCVADD